MRFLLTTWFLGLRVQAYLRDMLYIQREYFRLNYQRFFVVIREARIEALECSLILLTRYLFSKIDSIEI